MMDNFWRWTALAGVAVGLGLAALALYSITGAPSNEPESEYEP